MPQRSQDRMSGLAQSSCVSGWRRTTTSARVDGVWTILSSAWAFAKPHARQQPLPPQVALHLQLPLPHHPHLPRAARLFSARTLMHSRQAHPTAVSMSSMVIPTHHLTFCFSLTTMVSLIADITQPTLIFRPLPAFSSSETTLIPNIAMGSTLTAASWKYPLPTSTVEISSI